MKVAMIGHKVVPSRRGGIENVLTTLCPILVEKGLDVTCYNRSTDKIENEALYDGMYAVTTDLLDDDVKDILKVIYPQ